MKQLAKLILEQIASGQLDKPTGSQLLQALKKGGAGPEKDAIAITGMAVRLPDAHSVGQFWTNLRRGVSSIGPFPETRQRDVAAFKAFTYMQDMDVSYYQAGYLNRIDQFDCSFFGISPKEASLMDPSQRLFMEVAWNAIEDAGQCGRAIKGSRTGLYIGYSGWPMYGQFLSHVDTDSLGMSVAGNISAIIAGRIPHFLDLKGPSMLVDTACSSSLTALHLACQAIRQGECEQAIAGGISIRLLPFEGLVKYGIESSDSYARAFDDQGDGTSLSEAVVAVFLKPYKQAAADGDDIYAVIKGSAVNQDGKSVNLTAPNALAQEDVIVRAWKDAGIDPATITYMEAHSTATPLGDPIEIDGIQKAFRRYTDRKQFCAIGSVKSNIGHTDAAAGLVSIVKAALALKHKEIPPTLNFYYPNRKIRFELSPVYVNDKLSKWTTDGTPRRCGVSSFGISGTNSHVVLEEAPENHRMSGAGNVPAQAAPMLFVLSARSKPALLRLLDRYAEKSEGWLAADLADLCWSAATGREHYAYRIAVTADTTEQLIDRLYTLAGQEIDELRADWFVYGFHRVIPGKRTKRGDHDVYEADIAKASQAAQELVEQLVSAAGNSEPAVQRQLAELYAQGAMVDWERLYGHTPGKRTKIRLPGYPFEPTRCWLTLPEASTDSSIGMNPAAEQRRASNHDPNDVLLRPLERADHYEVSLAQEGLLSRDQAVRLPCIVSAAYVDGLLDPAMLQQAAIQLAWAHEALRTGFAAGDGPHGTMRQTIAGDASLPVQNAGSVREEELPAFLEACARPFASQEAPLARVMLAETEASKHLVLIALDPLIADEQAADLALKDLLNLYAGQGWVPSPVDYKEYAAGQRQQWFEQLEQADSEYRRELNAGDWTRLGLSLAEQDAAYEAGEKAYETGTVISDPDMDLLATLTKEAAGMGGTLQDLLLTAYLVLIAKYSGQDDVVMGVSMTNREHPLLQQMIGRISNTAAIRPYPSAYKTVDFLMQEVREQLQKAQAVKHIPCSLLLKETHSKRLTAGTARPLFEVKFAATERINAAEDTIFPPIPPQNRHLPVLSEREIEQSVTRQRGPASSPFLLADSGISGASLLLDAELALEVRQNNGRAAFGFHYRSAWFAGDMISRMSGDYMRLLFSIARKPGAKIGDISLLDDTRLQWQAAPLDEMEISF